MLEKAKERTGFKKKERKKAKGTSQDNQNYCTDVQDSEEQSVNQRSNPKQGQCKQLALTHLSHKGQLK